MLADDWMSRNSSELLKAIRVAKESWNQRQNRRRSKLQVKNIRALENMKNSSRMKTRAAYQPLFFYTGALTDRFVAFHE